MRVGAARASARIANEDSFDLYQQIEDVENAIIRATRERSLAWRKVYAQREGAAFDPAAEPSRLS